MTPDEWLDRFANLVLHINHEYTFEKLDADDVAFAKMLADVPFWIRVVAAGDAPGIDLKQVAEEALAAMQNQREGER